MNFALHELIIGLLSVIVFIYRLFVMMIPMFSQSLNNKDYSGVLKSLTLLV